MGYRQYLYSIDTWLVDEIKKCKTEDDFICRCRSTVRKYARREIVQTGILETDQVLPE